MLSDVIEAIAMMQQMECVRALPYRPSLCVTPCACTCSSPCPSYRRSSARQSFAGKRSATP